MFSNHRHARNLCPANQALPSHDLAGWIAFLVSAAACLMGLVAINRCHQSPPPPMRLGGARGSRNRPPRTGPPIARDVLVVVLPQPGWVHPHQWSTSNVRVDICPAEDANRVSLHKAADVGLVPAGADVLDGDRQQVRVGARQGQQVGLVAPFAGVLVTRAQRTCGADRFAERRYDTADTPVPLSSVVSIVEPIRSPW
jgi:hypothetical protein